MTTIAFIEDDDFYRQLLGTIVASSGRYCIVGSFASTAEALARLPPAGVSILVIDVRLVGSSGIAAIGRVHERWPESKCIMLTASDADGDVFAALEAGAAGYVLKSDSHQQILAALDEVAVGGVPLSRSVARRVLRSFSRRKAEPDAAITRREKEILDRLGAGLTYKEIAIALGISVATVKNHLSRIYEKLGVRSRTEAVVKWLRR